MIRDGRVLSAGGTLGNSPGRRPRAKSWVPDLPSGRAPSWAIEVFSRPDPGLPREVARGYYQTGLPALDTNQVDS